MLKIPKRLTTEAFIEKAQKIHGDRYCYDKVEYINISTKVTIGCPVHGPFAQTPDKHLQGQGCHECAGTVKSNTESFIVKAIKVHKENLYDYFLIDYKDNKKKIKIICNKCTNIFEQTPNSHLNGSGCSTCGTKASQAANSLKAKNEFEDKAKDLHGDKYDYTSVEYINAHAKVSIICNKCTNTFLQTPDNHLSGKGCPTCASYGFNPKLTAILYYLKVTEGSTTTFKIGITNRSVKERFSSSDLSKIQILNVWSFESGKDAYNLEQAMLKKFKRYSYKGPDILKSGNTELFVLDVFVLLSTCYNLTLNELISLTV